MTRRTGIAVTLCALLAACGGGDDGGNAAVGKTFTYGEGTELAPSSPAALAAQEHVAGALSLEGSTAPDAAYGFADIQGAMDALFDGIYLGALRQASPAPAMALAAVRRAASNQQGSLVDSPAFDETCVVTTDTSVTFKGCTTTESEGGESITATLDGSFSLSADHRTLTWALSVRGSLSSYEGSVSISYDYSGEITVTESTIRGNLLAQLGVSGTVDGHSDGIGMAVAILVDVTYADTCTTLVTGGTYEGKLVWTRRPSGYSAEELPNQGVLITWESCGNGSIAFSTN